MARLDPIFERLLREGTELLFDTGSPAIMRTHAGDVPVLRQHLAAQQIAGVFAEVVPSEMRNSFPAPCMYSWSISAAEASSMASPSSSAPFSAGRTLARTCPPLRSKVTPNRPAGAPYSNVVTPGAGKVLRISLGTTSAKTPAICCAVSC